MTDHDTVITPLPRGAPRLALALGPALARAGPTNCVLYLGKIRNLKVGGRPPQK